MQKAWKTITKTTPAYVKVEGEGDNQTELNAWEEAEGVARGVIILSLHPTIAEGYHKLAFFSFFSLLFSGLTLTSLDKFLSYLQQAHTHCYQFHLLTLFQTIKVIKSVCIQSHKVANTMLKLQHTTRFKTRQNNKAIQLSGRMTGPATPSRIGESAQSLISELTKASPSKVSTRALNSNW